LTSGGNHNCRSTIRATRTATGATRIELPTFGDATGQSRAAIVLPEEIYGPIGDAVLEVLIERGIAKRRFATPHLEQLSSSIELTFCTSVLYRKGWLISGGFDVPWTMNESEFVDLRRAAVSSFTIVEFFQAWAFSRLSNAITTGRSGGFPSSGVNSWLRMM